VTLLLNGCSYGWAWQSFPGINISQSGGSIARSVRTTMEWIVTNGKPDYVFIPLTMTSRFEIAMVHEQNIPIEGPYIVGSHVNNYEIGAKISDSFYLGWDYAFMYTTMFSAWLNSLNIKHLIWDQCNMFDREHIKGLHGLEKLKLIEANPRVVPLFDFCGNQYMYDNGGAWQPADNNDETFIRHYKDESYSILKEYLSKYMKDVLNEKVDW
jgi:hypothetical protein